MGTKAQSVSRQYKTGINFDWQSDKAWKQADIMKVRENLRKSGKFERKNGKLGKSQRIFIFGTQDVFLLL